MSDASPNPSDRSSVRPVVRRAVVKCGPWLFALTAIAAGGGLFAALESRRAAIVEPAVIATVDDALSAAASAPPLTIPPTEFPAPTLRSNLPDPQLTTRPRETRANSLPSPRRVTYAPAPFAQAPFVPQPQPVAPYPNNQFQPAPPPLAQNDAGAERVMAKRFANPSTTIPAGTVIQAVLESALDSTRAGMARAIVARDVRGFDGTRVLIPRGSRLIGEYKSDLGAGQKRALIQWQRLLRPDAVEITLNSPSADPLGRAGIEGKVHSHFLARFGNALLQSALNIGSQVAINEISRGGGVYVIPIPGQGGYAGSAGSGQNSVVPQISTTPSQPSLTVRQGASVSVFAARDLDFSNVDP